MRIDDPIFSGSGDGRNAFLTITGSFSGSGHIYLADTASYVAGNIESASIAETASYVTSSKVYGPFGSDSIKTASLALEVVSASYSLTSSHATEISGSTVTYEKLGEEFRKVITLGPTDATPTINFNEGSIFRQDLGAVASVTPTFTNQKEGDIKYLYITANGVTTYTLPATVEIVGGGTFSLSNNIINILSILCVDETTPEYIATFLNNS